MAGGHGGGDSGSTRFDEVLRLEIPVDVAFTDVIEAQKEFLALVRSVARAMHREPVTWLLGGVEQGSARMMVRPEPVIHDISRTVVDGVRMVGARDVRPPFFSDDALSATRALALLSNRLPSITLYNGSTSAPITSQVATNVQAIIQRDMTTEYGAVEGRLEALNVHHRRYFAVYDVLDNVRIECRFGLRIPIDTVRQAVERRVAVHGTIYYRSDRRVSYVSADTLDIFPTEDELPSPEDVLRVLGGTS